MGAIKSHALTYNLKMTSPRADSCNSLCNPFVDLHGTLHLYISINCLLGKHFNPRSLIFCPRDAGFIKNILSFQQMRSSWLLFASSDFCSTFIVYSFTFHEFIYLWKWESINRLVFRVFQIDINRPQR